MHVAARSTLMHRTQRLYVLELIVYQYVLRTLAYACAVYTVLGLVLGLGSRFRSRIQV
jgi:hypothetical protein